MTFIICALLALVTAFLPRLAVFLVIGFAFGWGWAFALLGLMVGWVFTLAIFGAFGR